MLRTYKAILRENQLEWSGEEPEASHTAEGIPVHVTILNENAGTADHRGERMAAALEHLASIGLDVPDPAAWERELRIDRNLPDRS